MGNMKREWENKVARADTKDGSIYMISTPKGKNHFYEQYQGEWVNDREIPWHHKKPYTIEQIIQTIRKGYTFKEIMKLVPVGIREEQVRELYERHTSEAWRAIYD